MAGPDGPLKKGLYFNFRELKSLQIEKSIACPISGCV